MAFSKLKNFIQHKGKKMENETNDTVEQMEQETPTAENESTDNLLRAENQELKQQVEDLKDKYIRLMAEFDNFKKRTAKERIDLFATAAQDTMSALIPVVDDFDRAKKAADNPQSGEVFTEGVALVYTKLHNILANKGLKAMESNGEVFDPEIHEAITEIPVPNDDMKGKIIDTVETGYFLNDKIIRYAKVVVGK